MGDEKTTTVLSCSGVSKSYRQGPEALAILSDITIEVPKGKRVAIIGASGSGKSTLLNVLGGLDSLDQGEVTIDGQVLTGLSENQKDKLRNQKLGFVYQFHHLLQEFSALENVAMPFLIRGTDTAEAKARALAMLGRVGLEARAQHKPSELSGGERQRVAIARALVTEPACVMMDEPTGNLDRKTAASVHELILSLNRELGVSFVIVTHDPDWARQMDATYELCDGGLAALPVAVGE